MSFLKGIGAREAVALVVLAIGLALGFAFWNPSSSGGSSSSKTPQAAAPRAPIEGLTWKVTWLEGVDPSSAVVVGQGELPSLDLTYEAAPFTDVEDDAWGVVATTTLEAPPGRYLVDVSYKGEVAVSINGKDAGVTPSRGEGHVIVPIVI